MSKKVVFLAGLDQTALQAVVRCFFVSLLLRLFRLKNEEGKKYNKNPSFERSGPRFGGVKILGLKQMYSRCSCIINSRTAGTGPFVNQRSESVPCLGRIGPLWEVLVGGHWIRHSRVNRFYGRSHVGFQVFYAYLVGRMCFS